MELAKRPETEKSEKLDESFHFSSDSTNDQEESSGFMDLVNENPRALAHQLAMDKSGAKNFKEWASGQSNRYAAIREKYDKIRAEAEIEAKKLLEGKPKFEPYMGLKKEPQCLREQYMKQQTFVPGKLKEHEYSYSTCRNHTDLERAECVKKATCTKALHS